VEPVVSLGDGGEDLVTIAEIGKDFGFKGSASDRFAEIRTAREFTIDKTTPGANNVYTRVDCYVAGIYIDSRGKKLEVKQRYTVFVAYSRLTQRIAMQEVRNAIISDFERNFPQFRIADVFIPEEKFILPLGREGLVEPAEFYYGSQLFKRLSRIDVARYKLATERAIYKSRVSGIKKRYGI